MIILLILGTIFTLGGVLIYIIGSRRGVNNAFLWSLFPILHGLHEFAEYLLDEVGAPFIVERFEIMFAMSSSIVLLMAVSEYLGTIQSPNGKIAGGLMLIPLAYFIFVPNEDIIETFEHLEFELGPFTTTFYRLFFGTVIVLVSILILLLTYYYLPSESKTQQNKMITFASSLLLLVFAFFEGFTSDNPIFITLRGISAVLFLLVPGFILVTNDLGLRILLVTTNNGNYITGYNFSAKTIVSDDQSILTGSFIAAISSFSNKDKEKSGVSDITTIEGRYLINSHSGYLISLLSRNTNKELRNHFQNFSKKVTHLVSTEKGEVQVLVDKLEEELENQFQRFYKF